MKKSIRDRIAKSEQRAALTDQHKAVVREQQRELENERVVTRPSRVLAAVGAPGEKFPLNTGAAGTVVAEAELNIGLHLRNGTNIPGYAANLIGNDFEWTPDAEDAARLAADGVPPVMICDRLGIDIYDFEQWMLVTEFRFRIRQHLEALSEHVMTSGLANRTHRLKADNDRWQAQQEIVRARAKHAREDEKLSQIPGAKTGWLNNNLEYDAALSKEMRETQKQAAIEAGQWQEGAPPVQKIEIVYADKNLIYNNNTKSPDSQ
jgi:hypothetical protein